MDKAKATTQNANNRIYEFFYALIYVSSAPIYFYIIFWTLGWLIMLTPLFLEISSKSDNDIVISFFQYFNIWTYISDQFYLNILTYSLFSICQVIILLGLYSAYNCDKVDKSSYEDFTQRHDQFQIKFSVFHNFLLLCTTILLQIETELLAFTIKVIFLSNQLASYKNVKIITSPLNTDIYVLIVLNCICFAELIFLSILNILFCQDRSLLKRFFWTSNTTYCDFSMLLIQIVTHFYFIFIPDVFFIKNTLIFID